jgi:hypothetical protein
MQYRKKIVLVAKPSGKDHKLSPGTTKVTAQDRLQEILAENNGIRLKKYYPGKGLVGLSIGFYDEYYLEGFLVRFLLYMVLVKKQIPFDFNALQRQVIMFQADFEKVKAQLIATAYRLNKNAERIKSLRKDYKANPAGLKPLNKPTNLVYAEELAQYPSQEKPLLNIKLFQWLSEKLSGNFTEN